MTKYQTTDVRMPYSDTFDEVCPNCQQPLVENLTIGGYQKLQDDRMVPTLVHNCGIRFTKIGDEMVGLEPCPDQITISEAATDQRKHCCSQCPYARATSKEYLDTRGDNSERFVGQGNMNAFLPCHMESMDNNATVGQGRQCAGAAKFRANIGVADQLRPEIGRLEPDTETVFATNAELLAHHRGWTVERAEQYLSQKPVAVMIAAEIQAATEANKFIHDDT